MPLGVLTSVATPATSTAPTVTLPASIQAGSTAYLVLNVSGAVLPTLTGFAGWTVVAAPTVHTTGGDAWLLSKSVGTSDSSTAASGTLSASQKWHIAVAVVNGTQDATPTLTQTTALSGTPGVPAITPVAANCLDLVMAGLIGGSGTGAIVSTPSSGFTEDLDNSTATGGNEVAVYVEHKQLVGQAGTSQGATTITAAPTARAYVFRVTVASASNVAPTANAGTDQTGVEPYATVTLNGTGSSDSDGTIASYAWTQTAGTTVTLSSSTAASPTFTAPAKVAAGTLTFSLVVTDNLGATSTADTVNVAILPHTLFRIDSGGPTPVKLSAL